MPTSTRTRSSWVGQHGKHARAFGATARTASSAVYRPRRPTATPLYPVVQHHLETFLAEAQEADPMGWGVPSRVERDFRCYLRCGILAHGFARLRCTDCGHDRLLAFSCKARGVCPSCNARRMAEVAAHLTDAVVPHLPVRQWVLSVPKRLRPFLHETPEVASGVLTIFLRALRAVLRDASPGAPTALRDSQLGAISFPQRFGGSLNPHYHYHVLALDGVVSGDVEHGVRFHEATSLQAQDAETLARTVQLRVLRWFTRRELLEPATASDMPGTRRRRVGQGTGGLARLRLASRVGGVSLSDTRSATRVLRRRLRPHRGRGPSGSRAARSVLCAGASRGTVRGGLSPWSGSTPPPVSRRSPRRTLAWCIGSPSPIGTVAKCFVSRPSSCSSVWPGSYPTHASTATAITGFWLPTHA